MIARLVGVSITACLLPLSALGQSTGRPLEPNFYEYSSVRQPYLENVRGSDYADMYRRASLMTSLARLNLEHHLDLAYGNHPKQQLDVYLPSTKKAGDVTLTAGPTRGAPRSGNDASPKAPVLIFFHGGGKQEGDRAHYGFVATHLAPHGIITVVPSYRLVGKTSSLLGDEELRFPAQEDDAMAAVVWVYNNIARYGGDPTRIFAAGHSNGAGLSASIGVDRGWLTHAGIPNTILRGIAPLSGGHRDITKAVKGTMSDRYSPTPEEKRMATPVLNINDPAPTVVFTYGEKEASDERSQDLKRFTQALEVKGVKSRVVVEPGADHTGAVLAMGNPDSPTFKAVLSMITSEGGE